MAGSVDQFQRRVTDGGEIIGRDDSLSSYSSAEASAPGDRTLTPADETSATHNVEKLADETVASADDTFSTSSFTSSDTSATRVNDVGNQADTINSGTDFGNHAPGTATFGSDLNNQTAKDSNTPKNLNNPITTTDFDKGVDFFSGWTEGRDDGYDFVIPPTHPSNLVSTRGFATDESEWVLGYVKGWCEGFDRASLVQWHLHGEELAVGLFGDGASGHGGLVGCLPQAANGDGGSVDGDLTNAIVGDGLLSSDSTQPAHSSGVLHGHRPVEMPDTNECANENISGRILSTKSKGKRLLSLSSSPESAPKRPRFSPASTSPTSSNPGRKSFAVYSAETRVRAKRLQGLTQEALEKGVVSLEEYKRLEQREREKGNKGWVGRVLEVLRERMEAVSTSN